MEFMRIRGVGVGLVDDTFCLVQMSANAGRVVGEVNGVEMAEGSDLKRQRTLLTRWARGCMFYSCIYLIL